jgi:hypothetical protein
MGWEMPWYSVQNSAERLLAGRSFNRFMLVCYLRDEARVFETYWTTGRGVEPMAPGYAGLLDRTVYGRQEAWEDSPAGWPQRWGRGTPEPNPYRTNGRPISMVSIASRTVRRPRHHRSMRAHLRTIGIMTVPPAHS